MARIVRSEAADEDLLAIAEYGTRTWGIESSILFGRSFNEAFALLAEHPDIGRIRAELGEGVRSWLHRGHVIYYAHRGDAVVIGRVLHGAADPPPLLDALEERE